MQCFTLLWQDESGGLEVLLPKKGGCDSKDVDEADPVYEWVGATPHQGTLVVNIADFLQRLSNDRFRSTVHRVYNRQSGSRYSMPFFFGFNYDAECAVVPTCIDEAHPAKYAPISCGKVSRNHPYSIFPQNRSANSFAVARRAHEFGSDRSSAASQFLKGYDTG